jgi:ATP-dependent DNA ligase
MSGKPPSRRRGSLWLHEIKHDGFRVIARKDGANVRLAFGEHTSLFLYGYGLIELNGNDLCRDPLEVRKTTLATRSYFRDVATGAFTFR